MNYQEFLTDVKSNIQQSLGSDISLSIQNVAKNNGIHYDGLVISRKDSNISPTIYLNQYYDRYINGTSMGDVYQDILQTYFSKMPEINFDTNFFLDFAEVCPRIVPKLINYDKNREQLESIPHIRHLDLAVVFQCLVNAGEKEQASILIREEHLSRWNSDTEALYRHALANAPVLLPYHFCNLMDILRESGVSFPDEALRSTEEPPMFLLTNQTKINGASVLLYPGLLARLSSHLGGDLIILPSSIHEVLLLPVAACGLLPSSLSHFPDMVAEVNAEHVEPDEILSDHAYLYLQTEDRMELIG